MKSLRFACAALVAVFLSAPQVELPAAGDSFSYQGRLVQAGAPVSGPVDIVMRLMDAESGGNELATQGYNDVPVVGGLFVIEVPWGSGTLTGADQWLELQFRAGASAGSYDVLVPRQKLTAAPYAVRAAVANQAEALVPPFYQSTETPGESLFRLSANAEDATAGLFEAQATNTLGAALQAKSYGFAAAIEAESTSGIAVKAHQLNTGRAAWLTSRAGTAAVVESDYDGVTYLKHVHMAVAGPSNTGLAVANGTSLFFMPGSGISSVAGTGTGVVGATDAPQSLPGFFAAGVMGSTDAPGILGVQGEDAGVLGSSARATGVIGLSAAAGKGGVSGYTSSTSGVGVQATNYGSGTYASLAGPETGVYAEKPAAGSLAAYFVGHVNATGTFTGGVVRTTTDHPLDPKGRTLTQSVVESAEPTCVLRGNVVLDDRGGAVVTVPDWYGAIVTDVCYSLTPVGSPAPGLYISQELGGTSFGIAGGTPGQKVSWQLSGTRNDAVAKAARTPVEGEKAAADRDRYLQPELYGAPAEMTIGARGAKSTSIGRLTQGIVEPAAEVAAP